MKKIRAIPTEYNRYKFRSRLEARWAFFFDSLRINYEYEPEGYYLSDGRKYLPDFRVTNCDGSQIYYEVKRKNSMGDGKLECLIKDLQKGLEYDPITGNVVGNYIFGEVLSGDPIDVLLGGEYGICPRCLRISKEIDSELARMYKYGISPTIDIYCFNCDVYMSEDSEEHPFGYNYYFHKGNINLDTSHDVFLFYKTITDCANAARKVRFEYGETPKVI